MAKKSTNGNSGSGKSVNKKAAAKKAPAKKAAAKKSAPKAEKAPAKQKVTMASLAELLVKTNEKIESIADRVAKLESTGTQVPTTTVAKAEEATPTPPATVHTNKDGGKEPPRRY
jgi:hypothetical protein